MQYYDYLTEFIFREDKPEPVDMIFIPGSGYGELAIKAAQLYRELMEQRYGKQQNLKIVVSGKYSVLLDGFSGAVSPEEYVGKCYRNESDFLANVLIDHGVSEDAIIREENATFTYENALWTRKLLEESVGIPQKVILVCQAFHARRSLMYYKLAFPEVEILVCPAVTQGITKDNWYQDPKKIDVVLGEVERCGNQFHDILKGTDKVKNLIFKEK